MNLTIFVPDGTTNHGDSRLLCTPPGWSDFVIFFFANYFAHAGSIILEPGISVRRTLVLIFAALVLPASGINRAVSALWRHALTERANPLQRAARARALCMVLRVPKDGPAAVAIELQRRYTLDGYWSASAKQLRQLTKLSKPKIFLKWIKQRIAKYSDLLNGSRLDDEYIPGIGIAVSTMLIYCPRPPNREAQHHWWEPTAGYEPVPAHSTILGNPQNQLDDDYYLAVVPPHASFDLTKVSKSKSGSASKDRVNQEALLTPSWNVTQVLIGLVQAIWGVVTIYNARGNQIQQYGFAAFGLTVVPYTFMSVLNGLGNLANPTYSTMYLIRTPMLTRIEQDMETSFEGVLSVELTDSTSTKSISSISRLLKGYVALAFSFVPFAIIGGLSGFRTGSSTQLQQGFTMGWLVVGAVYGWGLHLLGFATLIVQSSNNTAKWLLLLWKNGWGELRPPMTTRQLRHIAPYLSAIFDPYLDNPLPDLYLLYWVLVFSPPTIGGMIVVGMMLRDYGVCVLLS